MVWQKGVVRFGEFFALFVPSLINWLVPAVLISWMIPYEKPSAQTESVQVKHGGYLVVVMFLVTIAGTVLLHHFLELPPFLGMMTGLGILKSYGYFLRRKELNEWWDSPAFDGTTSLNAVFKPAIKPFDVFISMKRVEWDTLMFFYGIMLCVGGLGALGYLTALSGFLYKDLGATTANVLVGILSAVVDNIPVMFAVLRMNPDMSLGQWLLVTMTAGVGGSLLSIGSAAGVALMGQARGIYTFSAHLKWIWAIALGYAASIAVHLGMNAALFNP
jgi:Na+/H+ antiporter NhaD/arsenite permease-like protein